jgi:drug/metabolite transporter (DMT)-like permease
MEAQQKIRANLLLLLAAGIWGFAFVAQKSGMEHVGPFTFNGLRFALGSLTLLPLIYFLSKRSMSLKDAQTDKSEWKQVRQVGFKVGLILFAGASLQQIGIIYTTVGKAAFITGLYIVIVPLVGLFLKQRLNLNMGLGALIAAVGLYYLSITDRLPFLKETYWN